MHTKSSLSFRHFLLAVAVAALWGGSFIAIKVGLTGFPPFLFAALRFVLSAFPFVFFVPRPASWSSLFGVGLGFTLQFACLFLGIKLGAPAGLSSLLMQSQVVLTAILALFFFKERLRYVQWLGILIASLGIVLIAMKQNHPGQQVGVFVVLLGSLGWACANIFIKKSGAKNALHLTIWASLIPPIPFLGFSYLFERADWPLVIPKLNGSNVLALAYVAYFSTLLGYGMWGRLLRIYQAGLIAPFSMLVPIFGIGCGWLFLGEVFGLYSLFATAFIFAGIGLVVFRWSSIRKVYEGKQYQNYQPPS